MRLATGVIFTIFFNAFFLYSQTPDAGFLPKFTDNELSEPIRAFSLEGSEDESAGRRPAALGRFTLQPGLSRPAYTVRAFALPRDPALPAAGQAAAQTAQSRPKAFSYGSGYMTRQKIHKYASYASLPLFISEAVVGQKLFDKTGDEDDSLRSAHSGLAVGLGVLFGVNSVTGVWNMWEARKDPNGRTKRMVHGILMLAADAGFVATAALAPDREHDEGGLRSGEDGSTHRAVAFVSLGVATASYIYMLIAR